MASARTLALVDLLAEAISSRVVGTGGSTAHGPRPHCRLSGWLNLAVLSAGRSSAPTQTTPLHLPAPLRSTGITRLQRYYECSDSCARPRACWLHRSPAFTSTTFRAFCLQPPDCLPGRFVTLLSAPWASRSRGSGLRQSSAGSPVNPAESSSLATDGSFASRYSPPLLAETQLRSTSGP